MRKHSIFRLAGCGFSAAVSLGLYAPTAQAEFLTKSLQICDGQLLRRGRAEDYKICDVGRLPSPTNAQITVGQMYVQFMVPEAAKKWPLIIVHGSTHSGACVESTPQGTEGWAPYAVRNGLATYVVDQPGRGRSGNDESRDARGHAAAAQGEMPVQTPPPRCRISAGSPITAPIRLGSATSSSPAQPRPARTSPHASSKPHGWRTDDPSPPNIHPSPAGYLPAYALPHMARRTSSNPRNLDKTGTGTLGTDRPCGKYRRCL